jgi:hypothetical protein
MSITNIEEDHFLAGVNRAGPQLLALSTLPAMSALTVP